MAEGRSLGDQSHPVAFTAAEVGGWSPNGMRRNVDWGSFVGLEGDEAEAAAMAGFAAAMLQGCTVGYRLALEPTVRAAKLREIRTCLEAVKALAAKAPSVELINLDEVERTLAGAEAFHRLAGHLPAQPRSRTAGVVLPSGL